MFKLKKLIFKQIIFLLSIFVKPFKNYWLISLSHGGGSFEAENCKKYVFLSKEYMKERLMREFTGLVFISYKYLKIIKNVIKNLKKDKNCKNFFLKKY